LFEGGEGCAAGVEQHLNEQRKWRCGQTKPRARYHSNDFIRRSMQIFMSAEKIDISFNFFQTEKPLCADLQQSLINFKTAGKLENILVSVEGVSG
jgi:hypothetical protein